MWMKDPGYQAFGLGPSFSDQVYAITFITPERASRMANFKADFVEILLQR